MLSNTVYQQINDYLDEGLSARRIAKILNISKGSVRYRGQIEPDEAELDYSNLSRCTGCGAKIYITPCISCTQRGII